MKSIGFIFARSGSKGIPDKNIKLFGDKPLIAWSIQCALSVERIDQVIVSTDSAEIADIAREYGADTPFLRPGELATDESPEWLSWCHGLNYIKETFGYLPDAFVSVPATAPLRKPEDIERCLDEYAKGNSDVVITVTEAHRNPHFNMVKQNENGNFDLVMKSQFETTRRQDAPQVYDMTTICYVANPHFVLGHKSIFDGRVSAVHIPKERAIDIDTPLDFQIAELLLDLKKEI